MNQHHDVIVLGLGGMGSATAFHLARRGARVLGLDAHAPGHKLGSSHGHSRVTRTAYKEGPAYVPLVRRATALWRELERDSGVQLLTVTGWLMIGQAGNPEIGALVRSARHHDLVYEELTGAQAVDRFPGLALHGEHIAAFDPESGLLAPEACTAAHLDLAAKHGAELHHEEAVIRWRRLGKQIEVETERGVYECDRLSITAGPWASEVLRGLHLPLSVERVVVVHFDSLEPGLFRPDRCPVYVFSRDDGNYYIAPPLGNEGVKIGWHHGREPCTPETIRRDVSRDEVAHMKSVLAHYLPRAAGRVKEVVTCMYTMTPDTDFIIDKHPDCDGVHYAVGFSGHGFKFASVIGEILAGLAIDGKTPHDIGFLSRSRFEPALS